MMDEEVVDLIGVKDIIQITVFHNSILMPPELTEMLGMDFNTPEIELHFAYSYRSSLSVIEAQWGVEAEGILSGVFNWDNEGGRPYGVRSLSAGDAVVIRRRGVEEMWMCELIGWTKFQTQEEPPAQTQN